MSHENLLLTLSQNVWAIEPNAARAFFPLVSKILSGESIADFNTSEKDDQDKPKPLAVIPYSGDKLIHVPSRWDGFAYAKPNSVGVIPFKSVIVKYDQACGPIGTETLSKLIIEAANNPNIVGIIIDADSPGGAGNAVNAPSEAIEFAKTQKPVIAYSGNGMTASAMFWIASSANEIYATYENDLIGSIGTYLTLYDVVQYYEQQGIKIHEIYATKSTEKNKDFIEALKGPEHYKRIRENYIDPFNESFIKAVQTNRAGKLKSDEWQKGGLYFSKKAEQEGLIDGFKTFNEVVDRVFELAEQKNSNQSTKINTNMKFKSTWTALLSILGFGVVAEGKEPEVTESSLSDLNLKVEAKDQEIARLTGELKSEKDLRTTAENSLKTAQDSATEFKTKFDAAEAKLQKLKGENLDPENLGDPKDIQEDWMKQDAEAVNKYLNGK